MSSVGTMAYPFSQLSSCDGLTVIPAEDPIFLDALTSRSFIANFPADEQPHQYPEAVFVATTTAAVKASVCFCRDHNLRVSPRSGGHNWHAIFLQGKNSVILDVGGMDHVDFDEATKTITAGPGATSINTQIPSEYFFPSGHCPSVPLGGFILGGGYGTGFTRYGVACSLVLGVEVVLASGEVRRVIDIDTDKVGKTIMGLIRGSYHHFPAVITKYLLRVLDAPKCVLPQSFIFDVKDWRLPIRYSRDLMHRSISDTSSIETTIVFCHCPPEITKTTGMKRMIVLSLMVWSDENESSTRRFLNEQTKHFSGMALPSKIDEPLIAETLSKVVYEKLYPATRYVTDGYFGDESLLECPDGEYYELFQPLAESWLSDENCLPGPYSHTLLVPFNKTMHRVNGCDMAYGFDPSFEVMSYAIYDDKNIDDIARERLQKGLRALSKSVSTYTVLAEGDIRSGKAAFSDQSWKELSNKLRFLDPKNVFKK